MESGWRIINKIKQSQVFKKGTRIGVRLKNQKESKKPDILEEEIQREEGLWTFEKRKGKVLRS